MWKETATNFILTTMLGSENVSTKAIEGLIMTNLADEGVRVQLPRIYTRQAVPADRSEIPPTIVISKIPHLRDVSLEMPAFIEYVDVGILFGLNCPRVLRPRGVV